MHINRKAICSAIVFWLMFFNAPPTFAAVPKPVRSKVIADLQGWWKKFNPKITWISAEYTKRLRYYSREWENRPENFVGFKVAVVGEIEECSAKIKYLYEVNYRLGQEAYEFVDATLLNQAQTGGPTDTPPPFTPELARTIMAHDLEFKTVKVNEVKIAKSKFQWNLCSPQYAVELDVKLSVFDEKTDNEIYYDCRVSSSITRIDNVWRMQDTSCVWKKKRGSCVFAKMCAATPAKASATTLSADDARDMIIQQFNLQNEASDIKTEQLELVRVQTWREGEKATKNFVFKANILKKQYSVYERRNFLNKYSCYMFAKLSYQPNKEPLWKLQPPLCCAEPDRPCRVGCHRPETQCKLLERSR